MTHVFTLLTALIVAAVSELSRRFTLLSAMLIALPLTSILAFRWIYYESKDTQKIIEMSYSVFWLVIPSLLFSDGAGLDKVFTFPLSERVELLSR